MYTLLGASLLPITIIKRNNSDIIIWLDQEAWHLTQVKKQLLRFDMSKQMRDCCVTDGGVPHHQGAYKIDQKRQSEAQQNECGCSCCSDMRDEPLGNNASREFKVLMGLD